MRPRSSIRHMVAGESVWVGTVYGRAFPRFWAAVEPCDVKCGPDFHASSPACRRCQPLGAQEGQQFERLAGDNMEPVPVCQAVRPCGSANCC